MPYTSARRYITLISLILTLFVVPGCDDYDSISESGVNFAPMNLMVGDFQHVVYVEYQNGGVRLWGPYTDKVQAQIDGTNLSLTSQDDSLALFVYGYAMGDSIHPVSGKLKVSIERDFALYLSGLLIHSDQGPAIEVQNGENVCYLVLPYKSTNQLSSLGQGTTSDTCLYVNGVLCMDGKGTLSLLNRSWDRTLRKHILYARGGMSCDYAMTSVLSAIHTSGSDLYLNNGTWNFDTNLDTAAFAKDSVLQRVKNLTAQRDTVAKYRDLVIKRRDRLKSVLTSTAKELSKVNAVLDTLSIPSQPLELQRDSLVAALSQYTTDSVLVTDTLKRMASEHKELHLERNATICKRICDTQGGNYSFGTSAKVTLYKYTYDNDSVYLSKDIVK